MASFVLAKLLPTTKAIWAKIDAFAYCTGWIGTLDPNRVGKVD
jgi:hypothetical protein